MPPPYSLQISRHRRFLLHLPSVLDFHVDTRKVSDLDLLNWFLSQLVTHNPFCPWFLPRARILRPALMGPSSFLFSPLPLVRACLISTFHVYNRTLWNNFPEQLEVIRHLKTFELSPTDPSFKAVILLPSLSNNNFGLVRGGTMTFWARLLSDTMFLLEEK